MGQIMLISSDFGKGPSQGDFTLLFYGAASIVETRLAESSCSESGDGIGKGVYRA